jgi:hypothetical protein
MQLSGHVEAGGPNSLCFILNFVWYVSFLKRVFNRLKNLTTLSTHEKVTKDILQEISLPYEILCEVWRFAAAAAPLSPK